MELEKLRESIDAIDKEIVRLYMKRLLLAEKIGELKKKRGADVYDPAREAEKLYAVSALSDDADISAEIAGLYEFIMERSRTRQEKIIRGER